MVYQTARRVVVAVIGGTVVLIGVAMVVLPGPAIVVIPAGLAILGTEFAWARRFLKRLRHGTSTLFRGSKVTPTPPTRVEGPTSSAKP